MFLSNSNYNDVVETRRLMPEPSEQRGFRYLNDLPDNVELSLSSERFDTRNSLEEIEFSGVLSSNTSTLSSDEQATVQESLASFEVDRNRIPALLYREADVSNSNYHDSFGRESLISEKLNQGEASSTCDLPDSTLYSGCSLARESRFPNDSDRGLSGPVAISDLPSYEQFTFLKKHDNPIIESSQTEPSGGSEFASSMGYDAREDHFLPSWTLDIPSAISNINSPARLQSKQQQSPYEENYQYQVDDVEEPSGGWRTISAEAARPRSWAAYQNGKAVGFFNPSPSSLLFPGGVQACKSGWLLSPNVVVVPSHCSQIFSRRSGKVIPFSGVSPIFGHYDFERRMISGARDPLRGLIDLEDRLIRLGFPAYVVESTANTKGEAWKMIFSPGFNCPVRHLHGRRVPQSFHDLAYFSCSPRKIKYRILVEVIGEKYEQVLKLSTKVQPGYVFGYIPLEPAPSGGVLSGGLLGYKPPLPPASPFATGSPVYYLSHNQRIKHIYPETFKRTGIKSTYGKFGIMYSPGRYVYPPGRGGSTPGGYIASADYPNTFISRGADRSIFNVGAPVLSQKTNMAIGTTLSIPNYSGVFHPDNLALQSSVGRGDLLNAYFSTLPLSKTPNGRYAYALQEDRFTSPVFTKPITRTTNTLLPSIGRTSPYSTLTCPDRYFAAGVVGSMAPEFSGNLGLVCLPYNSEKDYQLDKAVVIAGGSKRNWIPQANRVDFLDYIRSVPSWNIHTGYSPSTAIRFNSGQVLPQNFAMCPPGFYISGLKVRHGLALSDSGIYARPDLYWAQNVVTTFTSMDCAYWNNSDLIVRKSLERQNLSDGTFIPGMGIGRSSARGGSTRETHVSCNQGALKGQNTLVRWGGLSFISGVDISVDQFTEGLTFHCQRWFPHIK